MYSIQGMYLCVSVHKTFSVSGLKLKEDILLFSLDQQFLALSAPLSGFLFLDRLLQALDRLLAAFIPVILDILVKYFFYKFLALINA